VNDNSSRPAADLRRVAAQNGEAVVHSAEQRRRILIGVCVALMAVIASVTGLNVAQREIAIDLDASQSDVLWMINIYAITLAALLLPLGAVGDRWGRKPVLVIGLTVFGIASAAAGLASSTEVMLAARFFTGVGAAMIMPVTLAVITSSFPDEERPKAIGIWTGVAAGGGIIGMYLSAVLVDLATWRWLFILPVALVAVALAMAIRNVPNSREPAQHRFDIVGSVLASVAVVGLIWTLHEGPAHKWAAPVTVVSFAVGVVASMAFGWWELRQPGPILDVRLFRDRRLASGSVTLLVVFGVQAGIFVVLFPYFQAVLGWSGLRSTLALMPMALLMMTASGAAPRLAARVGARLTMAVGVALGGIGLVLLALRVSADGGYLSVLPGMVAMGFGMGLSMTPSTEAITSSLPRDRQGIASALNDVTREFGTALGVALLGAMLTAGYRSAIDPRLDGLPEDVAAGVREGIATALAVAGQREVNNPDALAAAAKQSFVEGWQQSMWAGASVMAALLVFVIARAPRPGARVDGNRAIADG
jgi:EmrB/QacA subfamily drug resistance transporter